MRTNIATRNKDVLAEERKKNHVSLCLRCGKEFHIYWLTPDEGKAPREMTKCGPCHFKEHR